jgi:hypothetical protein
MRGRTDIHRQHGGSNTVLLSLIFLQKKKGKARDTAILSVGPSLSGNYACQSFQKHLSGNKRLILPKILNPDENYGFHFRNKWTYSQI